MHGSVLLTWIISTISWTVVAANPATAIVIPTIASSTASVLPSATGYSYIGCYNETTGVSPDGARALYGGKQSISNNMTASVCLAFCAQGNAGVAAQVAGIEYGRECYCAQWLSNYSAKLNDSACNLACDGNSSQICGGSNTLIVYNYTGVAQAKTGSASIVGQVAAFVSVAAAVLVLIAVL